MKPLFQKIEFYITNVCNLTCDHCNRFNNFDFKGWQAWADYSHTYQQWSDLIDLRAITIMGGEPTLNPTLPDWIRGLNDVFGIEVQVLTNGTRLVQCRGLYDAIAESKPRNGGQNSLAVSLHNVNDLDRLRADITEFLPGPVHENTHVPEQWGSDWQFSDNNGVFVNVYLQNRFETSSIRLLPNGERTLHNSNPVAAHRACTQVKFKSYHFIKGSLYKCGPVALMPEFDQQHPLDITDQDRQLLHSYTPLTVQNFEHYHQEFMTNLDQPLPQCKFCPEQKQWYSIAPVRKGVLA